MTALVERNRWPSRKLGELFEIQQGKAISPSSRDGSHQSLFLRTTNVLWNCIDTAIVDSMSFTSSERERLALRCGDLLVCEGGEIGRAAVWNDEVPGCLYQNHVHRLRAKSPDVDPWFIAYWLRAAFLIFRSYDGAGNRTTIPNLAAARLKQFDLPLPALSEQRAIVRILSKIQDAIDIQIRIVSTLKELKAATMTKVFREGLRGDAVRSTEIGEMPEWWLLVKLSDVCDIRSGGTPSRTEPSFWGGGIPWVKTGEVNYKPIVTTQETISQAGFDNSSAQIFPAGTIIMAMYGQGVTRGRVARLAIPAATNQACAAFLCNESIDPGFLYAYLSHSYDRLRTVGHGANQKNLSADILGSFPIAVSRDLGEQRQIATVEEKLLSAVETAERRLAALEELFDATLASLMSGEVALGAVIENSAPTGRAS